MTDRHLLQHLGRTLAATLSIALLVVTGIAYGEQQTPLPVRTVDVQYVR